MISSFYSCLLVIRALSPENRRANRSAHNTHSKNALDSMESMYGLRNNSSSSAVRPTSRTVGHNSDERVARRKLLAENNVDDNIVDCILNVSFCSK